MNLQSFKLREIYLEAGGERFDLHNCFDFVGFTYDLPTRRLSLGWHPNEYAPAGERRRILIEFREVIHVSVKPRNPAVPFTEDNCLSFVGYASPDAEADAAMMLEQPTADMHLVFCFMSQMRLRVYAEHAHVAFDSA